MCLCYLLRFLGWRDVPRLPRPRPLPSLRRLPPHAPLLPFPGCPRRVVILFAPLFPVLCCLHPFRVHGNAMHISNRWRTILLQLFQSYYSIPALLFRNFISG